MNKLICPKSGEPCEFLSYCDSTREALEAGNTIKKAAEVEGLRLPEEITEALDVSFCADERITALLGLADRSNVSQVTAGVATMMGIQMDADKRMFPTPHSAETA